MATVIKAGNVASGAQVTSDATGILQFNTGSGAGTAAITVDASQNVGIGTASPGATLDVAAATATSRIRSTTGTNPSYYLVNNTGGNLYIGRENSTGSNFGAAYASVFWSQGAYPIQFATNDAERMRIDSSGNVGIGTSSPSMRLDVQAVNGIGSITSTTGTNTVNWRLTNSGGTLFTAIDSSTGGNFTGIPYAGVLWHSGNYPLVFATNNATRMTLSASGNLGIGTTSPLMGLHLAASAGNVVYGGLDGNSNCILVRGNLYYDTGNARGQPIVTGFQTEIGLYNFDGTIRFSTSPTSVAVGSASTITERVRITEAGALLVGVTANAENYRTNIQFTGNNVNGLLVKNTSSSGGPAFLALTDSAQTLNNTGDSAVYSDSTTTRWTLRKNGGLANYQANNANLSDRREKTNFAPAKDYLDVICAIPVQTFNYIDQAKDDPGLTLGVVAQDVEAVAPELVMESDWSTEKDGSKVRLSIYQTDLQYALMKCIQELKAELDATKAEVTALKGAAQ